MGEVFINILTEWGIDQNQVMAIVTDSGANIKKAAIDKFGEKRHLSCLAHTINLIVEKSIEKTQEENPTTKIKTAGVPQLLNKVRCIVKYFKKSTKACDELRRLQKSEGNNPIDKQILMYNN